MNDNFQKIPLSNYPQNSSAPSISTFVYSACSNNNSIASNDIGTSKYDNPNMNPNNNNVPSDLFLTKSQVLLGPQSQSQIQTSSQQLQPLLGQQQILCSPEQPQLQFRPISLPQSQNTQQPTEVPILNFQVRDYNTTNHHHNQMEALMSRLNQLENLHYNYNKTLIGYLDHLNNVDKNLSEISQCF